MIAYGEQSLGIAVLLKRYSLWGWWVSKVIFCSLLLPKVVFGQVIPDGTTATPDPGSCIPSCTVMDGITDPTNTNLFHSFDQFSVPDGGTVVFDHPNTIRNVITRVTGNNESVINGVLRTNPASETNFFLLNPNGILFGPNGSLEIGGSFVATTANAIQFGNQGIFSANELTSDPALLTVNPSAFLFTQATPRPIISQSSAPNFTNFTLGLGVPNNKSLLLVGGDVILQGSPTSLSGTSVLNIPGGRVELGGIKETGRVELAIDDNNLSLTYPNNILLADVSLTKAQVNLFIPFSGAGTAIIKANNFLMRDSVLNSITFGPEDAGEILIQAHDSVTLDASTITSNTVGSGMGGNLSIITGLFTLNRSSLTVSTNAAAGNAGRIFLKADTILLDGLDGASFITSESFGSSFQPAGDTGEIVIQTDTLSIANSSRISTSTNGEALNIETAGNLTIDARERVFLGSESEIASETLGQRNAGSISINTPSLVIDNSTISAAVNEEGSKSSDATGQGGTVTLNTQSLTLTNNSQITSSTSGQGTAGAILLNSNSLSINFQDNSQIAAATTGPGAGGRVFVTVPEALTLTGNGTLSTLSTSTGPAGDITINTNGQLRIQDQATIQVSGQNTGNSGTLDITAGTTILNNGQLLASTQAGQDGNIQLNLQDALVLRNESLISAEAFNNANGGNVNISAPFIIALLAEGPNGSDIQASAIDGNGGRITIQANSLFNIQENKAIDGNRTNDLDATSGTGIDGEVIITALEVDPTQGTINLPSGLGTPKVSQGCQASGSSTGQFIASGRGGIPPSPYDPLNNDGIQEDIYPVGYNTALQPEPNQLASTAKDTTDRNTHLIEAQGWNRNTDGDIVLIAAEPTYHSTCQHTVADG